MYRKSKFFEEQAYALFNGHSLFRDLTVRFALPAHQPIYILSGVAIHYTPVQYSSFRCNANLIYNRAVEKTYRPKLFIRILLLVGAGLLLLVTCSCTALPDDRPWVYADLRALGSLDAPSPATDILAVYTRTTSLTVDIRVDLLDLNFGDKFTLRLTLWDDRDFSQTPLEIEVSSTGRVQASGLHAGQPVILPRVVMDPGLDTITVYLNRTFIGGRYHLDISTYTISPFELADEIQNIRSDAQPPVKRCSPPAGILGYFSGHHTGPGSAPLGRCPHRSTRRSPRPDQYSEWG